MSIHDVDSKKLKLSLNRYYVIDSISWFTQHETSATDWILSTFYDYLDADEIQRPGLI